MCLFFIILFEANFQKFAQNSLDIFWKLNRRRLLLKRPTFAVTLPFSLVTSELKRVTQRTSSLISNSEATEGITSRLKQPRRFPGIQLVL